LKKLVYVFLFISVTFLLTGCFNKEKKANEIIAYFDEVEVFEKNSKVKLVNFSSDLREITENGDIPDMIRLIEDVVPLFEEQIEAINQVELNYRATKKIRERHIELLSETLSYYEWQLEVLRAESPENELEEIMKEEADIFGLKTERDSDSYYMKGVGEIEKKKRELEKEIDHYWDAYNIGDYQEEE